MTISKEKLKTKHYILADYSYQTEFFDILAIIQKYLSFYPPSIFNKLRVIKNYKIFLGK